MQAQINKSIKSHKKMRLENMDFHFNNLLFRTGNPLNLKISKVQSEILKFTKLKISKIKMDWIL